MGALPTLALGAEELCKPKSAEWITVEVNGRKYYYYMKQAEAYEKWRTELEYKNMRLFIPQ